MFDNKKLKILSNIPDSNGWLPINYMIELFSTTLNIQVIRQPDIRVSKLDKIKTLFNKRRKRIKESPHLLIIIRSISDLDGLLLNIINNKDSFHKIAVWVIDSFWHERVSIVQFHKYIDHIFVMTKEDVDFYQNKTNVPSTFLGWGADALLLGSGNTNRETDLLRIGRQPECWDNDEENEQLLSNQSLVYQGRPPEGMSSQTSFDCQNYIDLVKNYYSQAKYVLAQSNFADNSQYTHPDREYITARWTDAIASGCVVIGCQPLTCSSYREFWPEASVHIQDFTNKVDFVEKMSNWNESTPKINHKMALRHLDWRWKFLNILAVFNIESPQLNKDIDIINKILST